METTITLQVRAFPVTIRDQRTGEESENTIIFTKQQLRAAQIVGQSSKELIRREYDRKGYTVLDIGKADKRQIELDLYELYRQQGGR